MSNLEQAALDGTLFRPTRVTRRDSMDSEDEPAPTLAPAPHSPYKRGGAQTGPKGVLNDHNAHKAAERAAKRASVAAVRAQQEASAITIPVVESDDEDEEGIAAWRAKRLNELRTSSLREVGKHGFVAAVERSGWVCVLIYEPTVSRCAPLLSEATRIARCGVRIVRARAAVLGFGVAGGHMPDTHRDLSTTLDLDNNEYDDNSDEEQVVGDPDPDVLPTLLAYKDGELEKTFVRVDFEIGKNGLEGLLQREGIMPERRYDE